MMNIDALEYGTEVLVSDKRFETLHLTKEGEKEPTLYAIVLTEEMKDAVQQGRYK